MIGVNAIFYLILMQASPRIKWRGCFFERKKSKGRKLSIPMIPNMVLKGIDVKNLNSDWTEFCSRNIKQNINDNWWKAIFIWFFLIIFQKQVHLIIEFNNLSLLHWMNPVHFSNMNLFTVWFKVQFQLKCHKHNMFYDANINGIIFITKF